MRALLLAATMVTTGTATVSASPDSGPTTDACDDACSRRDWILAEPGVGPEVGPLARLELGTAGLGFDDGRGGASATAAFARVRFAVGLGRSLGVRASATVQALTATEARFPLAFGAEGGGALAIGVSRIVAGDERNVPVAATLDGELASGPAVRSGLGLRALGDGRRTTIAPGLATAMDLYVATARGHVRYLRTDDDAAGVASAVELGVGASMRINWRREFWGGSWPLEAWLDYRHRRGVGGSDAREHEVRGGLDYTPDRWVDRVGVQLAGTRDRLDGGGDVRGLTMILSVQRGVGR